jgi:hypothetical protein
MSGSCDGGLSIRVEERFNRERVNFKVEPKAILWLRRVVLYGSIGLSQAKFTNELTLDAICVRQSAYRSNGELFHYPPGKRDTDPPYQASRNRTLDPFSDDEYIEKMSTGVCPPCGDKVRLGAIMTRLTGWPVPLIST